MNPFSVDNYVHGYLDRRMKYLIEEWNLARRGDVGDFSAKIQALEKDTASMKDFEKTSSARIAGLEERLRKLRGARK